MFPSPAKDYVRRKQTEENLLSKPGMLREDFVPLTLSTVALSDQKQPCPEPPERGAYSPRGQAFAKSLQHRYLAAPSRPRVTVNKHPCSTPVHAVDEQSERGNKERKAFPPYSPGRSGTCHFPALTPGRPSTSQSSGNRVHQSPHRYNATIAPKVPL